MAWFKKTRKPIAAAKDKPSRVPEGLWVKCPGCSQVIYNKDLATNLNVCPKCAHHFRLNAAERLRMLFDDGEWTEYDRGLVSTDPLKFTDTKPYRTRLKASIEATGLKDAVIVGRGPDRRHRDDRRRDGIRIHRRQHGRRGRREDHARHRTRHRPAVPVVIVCCSGGARMMEGALSLMQMAKICGALARLDRARLPYISVLTDPTTGGVTASFAMLGDLNIAEPKALIGFAGPRVIEQTIRQKLPEGFQRSEFLLDKGMLDLIVDRREMKAVIAKALRFMGGGRGAAGCRVRTAAPATPEPLPAIVWIRSPTSSASSSSASSSASTTSARCWRALGHPQRAFRSIHIAGTNGKGSVTAMVDAALRAAGHRSAPLHVAASRRSVRAVRRSTDGRSTAARDATIGRRTCGMPSTR